MFKFLKFSFIFSLFILVGVHKSQAQYAINAIEIEGNHKTKAYIIYRELPYKVGDVISKDSLSILNTIAQSQLVNTTLFNEVIVSVNELDSTHAKIKIQVKERWYFFPLPYFRWVDRNFSQWWNEQNRSLDRVNYGVNFRQSNFTGNNDKLVLGLITGYTQQAIVRYQFPFIDKKLHFGLGAGFQYLTQKEINYTTQNDKQVFYKTDGVIRSGYRANLNLSYRPNLFERHSFQIGFGEDRISDSAFLKEPRLLPSYAKSMSYADLSIAFSKSRFNYNAYPTQGNSTEFIAFQRIAAAGNLTSFQFRKIKAHSFSKTNFIYVESNSIFKILPNQNYNDQKLMGYGNMQMNGLEYYVIEGNAGTILKASFNHSLGSITVPNILTSKYLPNIKYDFWVKVFSNLGYAYNAHPLSSNKLSNTLLRTAGIGIDIISIYDFVLKVDYSVNQLGDKGLYLHGGINF